MTRRPQPPTDSQIRAAQRRRTYHAAMHALDEEHRRTPLEPADLGRRIEALRAACFDVEPTQ